MKRLTIDLPTRRLADAGFHEISRLRAYTGRPVGHSSCAIIRHQSGPSSCRTAEQVPITAIIITQPPLGEIAMSAHACVRAYVCLSAIISPNNTSDLHQIFVRVTYGRGSALLWRRIDTLRTSGFMDDVIFAHKPPRLFGMLPS